MPDGGCALSGLRNSAFPTIKPAPFRRPDKRERHPAFLSLQIPAFPPSIPAVAHTLSEQSSRLKICLTALAQLPIVAPRCPPVWRVTIQCGEVSEWLKEHAWKVCIRQRIGGSNPPLTAIIRRRARMKMRAFFRMYLRARGDENPRPGFDNGRQPVGQTTNAVSGLPEGRAKRVNPPSPPLFKMRACTKVRAFSFIFPDQGDENPRPGFDNG